ncbi:reverse transcriptase (RNA-dependent DNA polymerase) domain-containing protein [Hirsutella rhossiliensis]|uniref:Reverse transcriptase (RNA-dependent DNA polymerase) domain-containing protein n=1 Tax=Hirsutella rhossiliensis TaxID=111463 RepID=A0A9P8N0P8_9HYPO|nr:reverse transcriptase (RNA-dependent DNA polymerase) domain-containing protein [Hirsutella rhossiliensis]KAH0962607.1 reverse transcriptase (RNA-dependent DNA polymerase) domain-containing protein [Hirsutella rhossiliensis]
MGAGNYDLPVKVCGKDHMLTFQDALCAPDAGVNLVSVTVLGKQGCWILGNGEHAAIVKGGQIVLTATVANGVYVIDEPNRDINAALASLRTQDPDLTLWNEATDEIRRHSDPAALVTSQVQNPNLRIWHERLAHLSERNIKRLQGMSTGTWPLESLHIDICGPFPDTGYDGSRYWVAILDDYTQYGWTFSVATKDSLFPIFQAFLQKHETPTRRCLYVRMDLGGENRSTLLDAFCTDKAIEVIYAATEQHQQNGAIEVFHRVLSEKLNPTLIRSGLERKWWPYVLQSITYVRNLSPTAKLPITPYEAWHGEKPDVTHLRVIGSKGWALLPAAKRRKLQPKGIPCRMLGYQGHCNYILLDSSNRVFVSPNVIFVEHVAKPTVSERQPKRPKTGQSLDQLIREEGQQAECPPRTLRNGNNRTADTASLYTPETSTALFHQTKSSPLRYAMGRPRALAFKQAMQSDSAKNWHAAMADEIQSLKALRGKWGYEQQEGIDYSETFASVVRPESYRTIFAIAAAEDLEIEQMDVKTAFLYGDIDEEVYLEQPEGFEDGTGRVCRLKKAIYGLKQAPRIWFHTITKFLETLGYRPIAADVSVFVRGKSIIAIYVDDLLLTGACPCSHYLGIKVTRGRARRRIELSQRAYIEKILGPTTCQTATQRTPLWPQIRSNHPQRTGTPLPRTRPPMPEAVKRIMRYLKGTIDYVLVLEGPLQPIQGYTDADFAADLHTRRSTSGFFYSLGSAAISWTSKRQPCVTLSSTEAEYVALTQSAQEAIWLRSLMKDLSHPQAGPTAIHEDNKGAIDLANNPQHHSRTKHISLKWHFVREKVAEGTVSLIKIEGTKQPADGLTKALPRDAFLRFRDSLGVKSD